MPEETHRHRANVEAEEVRHAAEEDRRREGGFYFTGKQFAGLLGAILSVQMAANWWAAKSFVKEVAVDVVHQHNVDTEAHAKMLMQAQQERHELIKQIVVLQAKIEGIETMLRSLSSQGAFDVQNGNGNGKHR